MGFFSFLVLTAGLFYVHFSLSARLEKCEKMLKDLKKSKPLADYSPPFSPIQPAIIKQSTSEEKTTAEIPTVSQLNPEIHQVTKKDIPRKSFEIPHIIKENWMGVFGSIALVIGAAFFGLTADIMQYAEVRVGMMLVASLVFLGFSQKLKYFHNWTLFSGWLKCISGAVILFATLGAGGIQGLQFIDSPVYALLFLCLGIAINILLAVTSPSQAVASLHVILSILAFCIAPQAFILLPIGALIASIGLISSYGSKWDLHLLLIVIAFGIQNTVWTISLETQLLPWMQYIAIACSLVVGLIAACIHYSKKYESPKLEVLPLVAHISNWGLLSWNIWLHAQYFRWTPLILGAVAIAGFILARVAKKKKITWLYYTDILLSQLVAMFAIASTSTFSANYVDLSLIILVETLIFNFICRLQNEYFILRMGYLLQYLSYLVAVIFTSDALVNGSHDDR
jgi:hypothetical protein